MQLSRHSPLGVQGACSLFPIRCSFGYLAHGRRLSWEKTLVNMASFESCLILIHPLFLIITWLVNLTLMCLFCSGFNCQLYLSLYSLISWRSLIMLFYLQLPYPLVFVCNALMPIFMILWIFSKSSFNFPLHFTWNPMIIRLTFCHISFKFQWIIS